MSRSRTSWSALELAYELGTMVAVPLVLFALGGRVLDRYLGTSPWLLLLGILISIVTSSVVIMRKALAVISESEHDDDEETSEATNRND